MKYLLLFCTLFTFSLPGAAQGWQQVGDLNVGVRQFYVDTVDNLLHSVTSAKYNGTDTIWGMFHYDGQQIVGIGADNNACGEPACGSMNMVQRFKDKVYYGGALKEIGGISTVGMAGWNGSEWSPVTGLYLYDALGDSTNATVWNSYVENDSTLLVSGLFLKAGQDTSYSIARWNGTTWSGIPFFGDFLNQPYSLYHVIVYQNQIFVTGNFSIATPSGEYLNNIARYDEASGWHAAGQGVIGGLSLIYDVIVYKDELYICGNFNLANGSSGKGIMRWNGTEWRDVGGSICGVGIGCGMFVYKDKLYLSGLFECLGNDNAPINSVAVWDGERWCGIGTNLPFDNKISSVAFFNDTLYIGGGFVNIGGQTVKFFAKYVGDLESSVCTASDTEAAVGSARGVTLTPVPAVHRVKAAFSGYAYQSWQLLRATDGVSVMASAEPGSDGLELDVSAVTPGVYCLVVYFADGVKWTGKVVVVR